MGYLSGDLVLNLLDKYTSAYISGLWCFCTKNRTLISGLVDNDLSKTTDLTCS